ncbi:MAG TPA: hypothetical protein VKX49_25810 [Bryobacteraceae bacterium]|nr:hypothetical protein [Bryobacteraceae bacterium]
MSIAKHAEIGADGHWVNLWLKYQRAASTAIGVILIAVLIGIFARTPLAQKTVRSGSGMLTVRDDTAATNTVPTGLELSIGLTGARQSLRIRFNSDLMNSGRRGEVVAQPDKTEPLAEGMVAEWPAPATPEIRNMTSTEEPDGPGKLSYRISLDGGPSIQFRQFALP